MKMSTLGSGCMPRLQKPRGDVKFRKVIPMSLFWLRWFISLHGSLQFAASAGADATGTMTTSPIKTVVVLVMENRSFDHMLGFMNKDNPEINGLTGRESNPTNLTAPDAARVFVSAAAARVAAADPGHSYQAIAAQIFGASDRSSKAPPPMDGFAAQAESVQPGLAATAMSAFAADDVAVYRALTREFAVFDLWFASVPASTQPNRLYVHSATSHGLMANDAATLAAGLPQRTLFDCVADARLAFGVYYQQVPSTLFYRRLRDVKYAANFQPYDLTFKAHAAAGTLPAYAVIEPRYFDVLGSPANDDHPTHDVAEGQRLVKEVYEALRGSPQWNETLFVITYDEHGGFYDHVPMPVVDVPSPDGLVGSAPPYSFDFTRLGVRVPTIAVSPWLEAGTVVHGATGPTASSQYEHSSIPATVRKLLNLPGPPLTAREAWAGTFESILTRTWPRTDCPLTLPAPPAKLRLGPTNQDAPLSEFQEEMVLLASTLNGDYHRPSLPSPHAPAAHTMSVIDGYNYVTGAVRTFFAPKAGWDAGTHVLVPRN